MKKLLAIVLAVVFCFSLAACGEEDNSAIVEYVEENEDALIQSLGASFAQSSGMTCDASVEVEGMGFIVTVKINELDDLDDETKEMMQEAYNALGEGFEPMLEPMQEELPELEYFEIVVCEKDGDEIATMTIGEK